MKNYDEASRAAANIISAQIILKPNCVLGLATGSSPLGIYRQLVEWHKKGDLDFSEVKTINLDEYCGLSPESNDSYRYYMNHNLFSQININLVNTHVPNGMEKDAVKACNNYDEIIESYGGTDLQLLGIGKDGHIGFNEPSDSFSKGTHKVALLDSTINANKRFFEKIEDVPRSAYTMGIKHIMQAKKLLLVVSGTEKAEILKKALYGSIKPSVPASVLQYHNDLTVIGDNEALALL